MPVRYIGRDSLQKAKSLFESCRQLRDFGVGRIVYQKHVSEKWPTQKSYYRLTKVIIDMTNTEFRKGQAWGMQVFRGKEKGENQILTGYKNEWVLVPKEEEQEFGVITDVFDIDNTAVPTFGDCPPLLEIVLKRDMKAKGVNVPEKIKIPFVPDKLVNELDSEWA